MESALHRKAIGEDDGERCSVAGHSFGAAFRWVMKFCTAKLATRC